MRLPEDKRKKNAADRFRTILSADREEDAVPEKRKPAVLNLPRLASGHESRLAESPPSTEGNQARSGAAPGGVLQAFWTIACILSLLANAVLLTMLLSLKAGIQTVRDPGSNNELLVGLYTGIDLIDKAHIKTTIPIRSEVSLDSSLPIQSATRITLVENVVIDGAHVKIDTEALNIDAPASVSLPAGTPLDVALDFQVPLQATVPIAMDVPVDIAVKDTELHPAILGLQQRIRPLLCSSSPQAALPTGEPICR